LRSKRMDELIEMAEHLQVTDGAPAKILNGRDLIARGLCEPGPRMGEILARAYEAQLDGEFSDLEGALMWFTTGGADE